MLAPTQRSMSYSPLTSKPMFYRIRGIAPDDRSYYSNIISLQTGQGRPVQLLNTLAKNNIAVNSTGKYEYQLLLQNGQILQRGRLQTGYNNISLGTGVKGLLLMRIFDGNQHWSEKLVLQ